MSHNTYRVKQNLIPPFLRKTPPEPTRGNGNQREVCFEGTARLNVASTSGERTQLNPART
jgi:hypothetical protein